MIGMQMLQPPVVERPDAVRVQRAVVAARLRYPGAVGDFLARELDVWRTFGYRFESTGRLGRLVDALLDQETPTEAG